MKTKNSSKSLRALALILALGMTLGLVTPFSGLVFAQGDDPAGNPAEPPPLITEEPTTEPPPPVEEPTPTTEPTEEPTIEPTPEEILEESATEEPEEEMLTDLEWSLRIDEIPSEQLKAAQTLKGELAAQGYATEIFSPKGASFGLSISGQENPDEIRELLFSELSGRVDFIGGAAEIDIEMPVDASQTIRLALESNITTGYNWDIAGADVEGSPMTSASEYTHREGYGVPGVQTITLTGAEGGGARIRLVYRRPFGPVEEFTRHLTIRSARTFTAIDLSNPQPLSPAHAIENLIPKMDASLDELRQNSGLPSSWDWRDHDAVPPVRDQENCGSCWAFGTVGVMESAMLIKGVSADLSEQFLVDCNKDGWNCDKGGLTAHKYHYNTLGKNQSAVGAVLEAHKPYTGTDGTCPKAYSHPYKLSGWKFVAGSERTIPTVEQIKDAIFTYGPITAGVCVGNAFQIYTGGVFTTDEVCGGGSNHQIILVGWNDSTHSWILRNSWGGWWGEGGYMRIAYGKSQVGEGTSWVTYAAPVPKAPALVSPTSASFTNNPTPEVTWGGVESALSYQLQISSSSAFATIQQEHSDLTGLSETLAHLADGKYFWRVRAKNFDNVYGPWSAARYFTVDTVAPPAPLLLSPAYDASIIGTPTFKWAAASGASSYYFAYNTSGDPAVGMLYTSPKLTRRSHKPPQLPTYTDIYWFVAAGDRAGNLSDWSSPFLVTILPPRPAKPVLLSPPRNAFTNDTSPTLSWRRVDYGINHHVQIAASPKFQVIVQEQPGVDVAEYTAYPALPDGSYYWRVRARNVDGVYGSWSAPRKFTVDTVPPPAPVLVSPKDGSRIVGTPTFSWKAVSGARLYHFAYGTTFTNPNDSWGSVVYHSDFMRRTSHKPPTMKPYEPYFWFVQARDAAGNTGEWSGPFAIEVIPPIPARVSLKSPINGDSITDPFLVLEWNAVAYGYLYEIQIDDQSTFPPPYLTYPSGEYATVLSVGPLATGKWFWRVRARNVDGVYGPWSAARYFIRK